MCNILCYRIYIVSIKYINVSIIYNILYILYVMMYISHM